MITDPANWAPCLVVDIKESTTHAAFLVVFPSRLTLPSIFRAPSTTHFLIVCTLSECCFFPPNQNNMCTPLLFYQHLFSLHNPITQPHVTPRPVTQSVLCSIHPTHRHDPSSPFNMSHLKPFSPLTPIITPTLHDHPRTNLVPWKIAINRAARGVFAEWDAFGFLFGVCDDAVWAVLNTPPEGPVAGQTRFPDPGCHASQCQPCSP